MAVGQTNFKAGPVLVACCFLIRLGKSAVYLQSGLFVTRVPAMITFFFLNSDL